MAKKYRFLVLILLLGILLLPLISLAGEYQAGGTTVQYSGLVPCGKSEAGLGESQAVTMPCTLCHIFVMLKGIIDFFLLPPTGIVFIIGILMIVIAGSMFIYGTMISPGDPKLVSNAQKIITSTIIGLIIVFGSWVFVNAFFLAIGVQTWTGLQGDWFTIQCDIELPEGAYAPPVGNFAFGGANGSVLSANIGENIDLGINFASEAPVDNMHITANFNNNLLELVNIIPNTAGSNFKTFLPIDDNGFFDIEKIKQQANESGIIENIGATSFNFNTGEFAEPQSVPIESLFTFIFKGKQKGIAEIILDSENSQLIPAIGDIANILEIEENKIQVIIE